MSISPLGGMAPVNGLDTISGASGAGMPPRAKMASLFANIDTARTGSINQAQFNTAFATRNPPPVFQKAGADAVWAALDPNGSGSVGQSDFISIMTSLMSSLRAAPDSSGPAGGTGATTGAQSPGATAPGAGLNLKV